jgi:hypothetical protein
MESKYIEENLSKELENSCKISNEAKIQLKQKPKEDISSDDSSEDSSSEDSSGKESSSEDSSSNEIYEEIRNDTYILEPKDKNKVDTDFDSFLPEKNDPLNINEYIKINILKESKLNIFKLLTNSQKIKKLIYLYQSSQNECVRNGKLTPEIGSFREKDIISWFSYFIKDVRYNINNSNEEDVIIKNRHISIKHSSNIKTVSSGIKVKWTVDKDKQIIFIDNYIFKCDILLLYIRFDKNLKSGTIEIIYVLQNILVKLQEQFKLSKQQVFKTLNGNSRGIELNNDYFKKIIEFSEFHITINFKNIKCNYCNPIEKRKQLLKMF